MVGDLQNALIVFLVLVSRLLDHPVSLVLKSVSCGGKSRPVEAVTPFFPSSAFHAFTAMSNKALVHSSEPFEHRILISYEAAGLGDNSNTLIHSLLSAGYIEYDIVEPKAGGGFKTVRKKKNGPTGLITTTTATKLHPEIETRVLSLTASDSEEQTAAIMVAQASEADEPATPIDWRAYQEWLAAGLTKVTIPFGTSIAKLTRDISPRLRRDFPMTLSLVRTHALLHRNSRNRKSGKIVADIRDYRAVWKLIRDVISVGVEATVAPETRETVTAVNKLKVGSKPVTYAELAQELELDKSSVKRRVDVAIERGHLRNLEKREGKLSQIVIGDPLPEDVTILPSPKKVLEHYLAQKKAAQRSTPKRTIGRKPGSR